MDVNFNDRMRQVLGRPVCDRGAIPRTLVQSNVVRSRLIILINEEINEANGPDKIVAKKNKINKIKKGRSYYHRAVIILSSLFSRFR